MIGGILGLFRRRKARARKFFSRGGDLSWNGWSYPASPGDPGRALSRNGRVEGEQDPWELTFRHGHGTAEEASRLTKTLRTSSTTTLTRASTSASPAVVRNHQRQCHRHGLAGRTWPWRRERLRLRLFQSAEQGGGDGGAASLHPAVRRLPRHDAAPLEGEWSGPAGWPPTTLCSSACLTQSRTRITTTDTRTRSRRRTAQRRQHNRSCVIRNIGVIA